MDAAAESTAIPPRRGFGRSNSHEPSPLWPWEAHAHVAADGCSAATRKRTKKKKTSCAARENTPRRRWNGSAPEPRSVPTCSGRPPWSWKPCDKHVQMRTCHEKRTSFVAFRRRSLLPPLADAFATKKGERDSTTSWRTPAALLGWQRRVIASFSNDAEVEQMVLVLQRQATPPRGPGQVHPQTHELQAFGTLATHALAPARRCVCACSCRTMRRSICNTTRFARWYTCDIVHAGMPCAMGTISPLPPMPCARMIGTFHPCIDAKASGLL